MQNEYFDFAIIRTDHFDIYYHVGSFELGALPPTDFVTLFDGGIA